MEHAEAEKIQAVERYLLGEMTDPEAEAFEAHFFECQVCTQELTLGAVLHENARAMPARETAEERRSLPAGLRAWWRQPAFAAPAFAALALALVTGYQARELALRSRPQTLAAYTLRSVARGEEQANVVPAYRDFVALSFDLPDNSFPQYRCELYGPSERPVFSVTSPAPIAGAPLSILVSRGLAPANYLLKVWGVRDSQAALEVAHYRVAVVKP